MFARGSMSNTLLRYGINDSYCFVIFRAQSFFKRSINTTHVQFTCRNWLALLNLTAETLGLPQRPPTRTYPLPFFSAPQVALSFLPVALRTMTRPWLDYAYYRALGLCHKSPDRVNLRRTRYLLIV